MKKINNKFYCDSIKNYCKYVTSYDNLKRINNDIKNNKKYIHLGDGGDYGIGMGYTTLQKLTINYIEKNKPLIDIYKDYYTNKITTIRNKIKHRLNMDKTETYISKLLIKELYDNKRNKYYHDDGECEKIITNYLICADETLKRNKDNLYLINCINTMQ